ncbi:MAG: hypothetical protein GTO42_01205 [Candidatus Latescibacteria bacterium]|nr:hypothetical protein [Candidatus Latescibacterota bacterium]NIO27147.1 hypothetical protein [Candidatus Latescibacterota bacterium]NIO54671.1 hypothetical protein [Candidatus Latescibacterota bacterium]NIT00754.1 hypothetical protein [Candidatus Latescibacterota bacterium]NIT37677.1 hypothetical protein [Candidatus Latescibacterota bacterium]
MEYDPLKAPDPQVWIEFGEADRIGAVLEYHKDAGFEAPNERLHAVLHVVVENQLAMGEAPVLKTLGRLLADGLDRHDAVHAIGSVLARHMYKLLQSESPSKNLPDSYYQDLACLTADSWRESG